MALQNQEMNGLSDAEVVAARNQFGENKPDLKKNEGFMAALKDIVQEPMFMLLLVASIIYFVTGHTSDGIFMASAIILVSAISLYQDSRSRNALAALKLLTQPHCKVIRNGETIEINSEDIVMGDLMVIEEGTSVPADGIIISSHDFSINESILTGESFSVFKSAADDDHKVYQGTSVAGGLAICRVTQIGNATNL
jgi:Ca2+-transporting ATPase